MCVYLILTVLIGRISYPLLMDEYQRHRKVKKLAKVHRARKCQNSAVNRLSESRPGNLLLGYVDSHI